MDWATTLAKELKQRENPQMLGAILGIVITPPPALKISILNGSVFITNCYILTRSFARSLSKVLS